MRTENTAKPIRNDNREKDPEDWVTGDESMTGHQRSIETLCREAGEPFDPTPFQSTGVQVVAIRRRPRNGIRPRLAGERRDQVVGRFDGAARLYHEGIPVSDPRFHMPFSDPATVREVLEQATLSMPAPEAWMQSGGRSGRHSEHLGHLLAEMQHLQRTYPGAVW